MLHHHWVAVVCWIAFAILAAVSPSENRPGPTLSAEESAAGFVPIFDGKSLAGWEGLQGDKTSYYVERGELICRETGKVHIFTKKEYAKGHIGLHAHGNYGAKVYFRNIRIKELP